MNDTTRSRCSSRTERQATTTERQQLTDGLTQLYVTDPPTGTKQSGG